jgi:glycosyltransferase involved in cell wall biosynthesis
VPYYVGPWQYLRNSRQVAKATRNAIDASDAAMLYVSGRIATGVEPMLRQAGHPYGVYVIGDPYDVFAPGSIRHPLRPFFRWIYSRQLRHQCAGATAAAYITEQALQRRYPPAPDAFTTHYAMGTMADNVFVPASRPPRPEARTLSLITVGTMAQLYKAQDVLIDALAACVQEELDLKLILVGDGQYRPMLEARAAALGLGERVSFRGQLTSGDPVRSELDHANLFVLPSHQEGLPRALIEAMARALPCIGSTVGGIPELLPPEDLVSPGDVAALARKIREMVTDPQRMAHASARNLERAKAYREEALFERRVTFYRSLRERTESWLKNRN